jgi:defect-in-organelle-trafficking protein DotD
MRPYWLVVTLTLMLAACATQVAPKPAVDPTMVKLQATAEEVSQSLRQLAETQQAAKPWQSAYPMPQSGPLAQAITLSWAGPPEPVLRVLADMIGYEFRAVGKPPLTADVVTLEARRVAAWTVLENIGWQLGSRATVVVNEGHREIQLVYIGQQP